MARETYVLMRCKWCSHPVGELAGSWRGKCPNRSCRMWLELSTSKLSTHVDSTSVLRVT